jgi:hypothetical protein
MNIDFQKEFEKETNKMSPESFEHIIRKEQEKNPYTKELIDKFIPDFDKLVKEYK